MSESKRPRRATLPNPEVDVTDPRPRPNAPWRCGYSRVGEPCRLGPTLDGKCCYLRESPQEPRCGEGGCEAGCSIKESGNCQGESDSGQAVELVRKLGPCVPERNNWFSRQNLASNLAILVGGLMLLCMAIPQREAVFVPGGLSEPHAQILGNHLVAERCSLCHPNSHPEANSAMLQDELCLSCHAAQMPQAHLSRSHDLTLSQIATLQSASKSSDGQFVSWQDAAGTLASETRLNSDFTEGETRCAQCHIEHHGRERDLKAITNQRCQACHQEQFASFAHGHPQFEDYPYRTERRIAFDHQSHAAKYFKQKNQSFDCNACHIDADRTNATGSVFRSVSFEKACASCHEQPIQSAITNGWALLQVPCIAPEDREHPEYGLGDWPREASFDYDGELSVAMRLLLSADPECRSALEKLPSSGKLTDISKARRPEITRTIARGFRKLVREVAQDGKQAWQDRIQRLLQQELGREPNDHEAQLIKRLATGMPPDLFRFIEGKWFGTAGIAQSSESAVFRQVATQEDLLLEDATWDSDDELLLSSDSASEPASDDALLSNGGLQEADEGALDLAEDASDEELLLSGDWGDEDSTLGEQESERLVFTDWKGAQHVSPSGWYLDKQIMAIRYMPKGHADPLLAAWTELAIILERDGKTYPHAKLRAGQVVPGECTTCHLIGDRYQADLWTNWGSIVRPDSVRLFTKFNHRPHLTLPTVSDCRYCHVFHEYTDAAESSVPEASASSDERFVTYQASLQRAYAHEFQAMTRSQCVACHRSGGANGWLHSVSTITTLEPQVSIGRTTRPSRVVYLNEPSIESNLSHAVRSGSWGRFSYKRCSRGSDWPPKP